MRGSIQLKAQIRSWAESNGLWAKFVDTREKLKRAGVSAGEAWLTAAQTIDPEKWGATGYSGPSKSEPVVEVEERVEDLPRGRSTEVGEEVPVAGGSDSVVVAEGATKAVFGGKKVATVKVVEWVASNMQVEDVSPRDAPSSEAWGMLVWARRSPVNESQFWGSIYAKLLPSRSQIDGDQKYSEDGVKVEDLAARLLRMKDGVECQREAN